MSGKDSVRERERDRDRRDGVLDGGEGQCEGEKRLTDCAEEEWNGRE